MTYLKAIIMLLSAFESSAQENDKFICLSSRQKQKRRKKSLPDLPSKLKDKKKIGAAEFILLKILLAELTLLVCFMRPTCANVMYFTVK